jgi:hypothetical protein
MRLMLGRLEVRPPVGATAPQADGMHSRIKEMQQSALAAVSA